MRVLLDTHVLLWTFAADPRLTPRARDLILADDTEVFVSAASFWEIAIKHTLGKLALDVARARHAAADSGFVELPVRGAHAETLATLPLLHRDPFDRLLVAQAMTEPMRLLTDDGQLGAYSALVLTL